MAGMSNGSSGQQMPNKVDQQFSLYLDGSFQTLCDEVQNLCDLAVIQEESACKTADIKCVAWTKSKKAYEEYTNIKQQISIKLGQSKDELVENIGQANASFTKVTEFFGESISCIKNVQKEFVKVVEKANALDEAIKNHCNKPEFNEIEKKIRLKSQSDTLKGMANTICNKAGENFDAAVMAAGVHALLHFESLVNAGKEIDECITEFNSIVDTNLTDAEQSMSTYRQVYDEAIKVKCKAQDDLKVLQMQLAALQEAKRYINPSYSRPDNDTMEQILQEAEKNYLPPAEANERKSS